MNVHNHAALDVIGPDDRPPKPARHTFLSVMKETIWDFLAALCSLLIAVILEKAHPRHQYIVFEYLYRDKVYPHQSNTIPSWSVPIYSVLLPLAAFIIYRFISRRTTREVYRLLLTFLLAVFLTGAITVCLKLPVGRLRPNFVRTCWPDGAAPTFRNNDTRGGYAVCSCSKSDEAEIRKSWPSGHSSWSAAGLGFFSFWLLGQLKAFAGEGHVWRFFFAMIPAFFAVAVGVTRVTDYWHHYSDVLTGLVIGFVTSFLVYRTYYPSLTDKLSDVPSYRIAEERLSDAAN